MYCSIVYLLKYYEEHGSILIDTMAESFRISFGNQINTILTTNIHEAMDKLTTEKIDILMIEPKHIGEYNYQDRSLKGQAKAGINFIKDLKSSTPKTKVIVLSDFESG